MCEAAGNSGVRNFIDGFAGDTTVSYRVARIRTSAGRLCFGRSRSALGGLTIPPAEVAVPGAEDLLACVITMKVTAGSGILLVLVTPTRSRFASPDLANPRTTTQP
jgi:hypothetical protein